MDGVGLAGIQLDKLEHLTGKRYLFRGRGRGEEGREKRGREEERREGRRGRGEE